MGYELTNFCEFDKYAIKSYCAVHGVDESLNLGDITKVDETKLPQYDMICGGSPCFPAGTMIETDEKPIPIECIIPGMMVLTHKNRYMRVERVGGKTNQPLYMLNADNFEPIYATDYHPFYVIKEKGLEPEMVALKDIVPGHYIAKPLHLVDDGELSYCFKKGDHIWFRVKSVEKSDRVEDVYNLEVQADHTYIANGAVVSNCQDFSLAGKQAGSKWRCIDCGSEYNPLVVNHAYRDRCPMCDGDNLDKTRSSLLVEWLRIIKANHPKLCVYENVKNITGKKFKDTFDMFINELHDYGYNTYWKVLNAKDYGVPQNRERVYVICVDKELDNGKFEFPEPFDNGIRLKDVLDDEVEERFYIDNEKTQKLIEDLIVSGKLDKDVSNSVRVGGHGSTDRHEWDLVKEDNAK